MPFKRGQSGNPRGKSNPGKAGRKPDWLKEKCANLVEDCDVLGFLSRVVEGKEFDHKVTKDGDIIEVEASIHDRLDAARELLDRGFGKSAQVLSSDPENPIGAAIFVLPSKDAGSKGGIS